MININKFTRCIGIAALALSSAVAYGEPLSASVQRGVDWLTAQIGVTGEITPAADAWALQAQSETALALKDLNQPIPSTLVDNLMANPGDGLTQVVVRKAWVTKAMQHDTSMQLNALASLQQANGGFAADLAHTSHALDTSYALLALALAPTPHIYSQNVVQALQYLSTQQYSNGAFGIYSISPSDEQPSVFATGYAVLSLASWRAQYNVSPQLANAHRWLLAARKGDGSFGNTLDNAIGLMALSRQTSEAAILQPVAEALLAAQSGDGSWGSDTYLTAVALRALAGYTAPPPPATTASIAGVLVDKDTLAPLSNVTVQASGVGNLSVASAADGSFMLTNLEPGVHGLTFTKVGYALVQSTVTATVGQLLDLGQVQLKSTPSTANLSGVVKDVVGMALANALVSVGNSSTLTSGTGAYSIAGLEAGTHDIVVSLSGYQTITVPMAFTPGQSYVFSPTLHYVSGEDTSLSGQVVDAALGVGLANARVAIEGSTAQADASGRFTLSGLTPGAFTVSISAPGYISARFSGTLVQGVNQVGKLPLSVQGTTPSKAAVSGVVQATGGVALAGVAVAVGSISTSTAADGSYTLEGIAPGYANITATRSGYQTINLVVQFEAGKSYLFSPVMVADNSGTNPSYATLTGSVVDAATDAVVADATVSLGGISQVTTAEGVFSFANLSPGAFTLNIAASGYQGASFSGTTVLGVNDAGKLAISKTIDTRKISGVVTDGTTGSPITGATVSVLGQALVSTTGPDGRYSLSGINTNSVQLSASATGYVTQRFALTFTQPGDATLDMQLARPIASQVAINFLRTDQPEYAPNALVTLEAEIQNSNADAASLLVEADVLDAQNQVVYTFMANAPTGWAGQRQPNQPVLIPPNGATAIPMEWNMLRQAAGNYQVRARAIDAKGRVIAEEQASFVVSSMSMLSGGVTTTPPLVQYGTQTPVVLVADVTNVGNKNIPAGNVDVRIVLDTPDTTTVNQTTTDVGTLATGTPLDSPIGLVRDAAGNLYTVNQYDDKVLKFDAQGQASVLAVLPGRHLKGLARAPNGEMWVISDAELHRISGAGEVTSFTLNLLRSMSAIGAMANGELVISGTAADGTPSIIRRDAAGVETILFTGGGLQNPVAFAKDEAGNYVVTNYGDSTLAKVSAATGEITPFVPGGTGLNRPRGITRDAHGNFYVANSGDGSVIKVTPAGATSTYASGFNNPQDVKFDRTGNLYVSSSGDNTIYTVAPNGTTSVFAQGIANRPQGMKYDAAGNLWIANDDGTLRKKDTTGAVSVVATGLSSPRGLVLDSNNTAYIANYASGAVQKVESGVLSTFATGLAAPWGVALDADGLLWVTEMGANRLKAFDASGTLVKTIDSLLDSPYQVRVGKSGEIFARNYNFITVQDGSGARILYKDADVVMDTIVVDPSTGDLLAKRGSELYRITLAGTASKFATLPAGGWYGLAADMSGNAYVIEYSSRTIYKATAAGVVSVFSAPMPQYATQMTSGLDGKPVVFVDNNRFYTLSNMGMLQEKTATPPNGGYNYQLSFAADGSLLGVGYSDLYVYNKNTGAFVDARNLADAYYLNDITVNTSGVVYGVNASNHTLRSASGAPLAWTTVLSGIIQPQDIAWNGSSLTLVTGGNSVFDLALGQKYPQRHSREVNHSGYLAVAGADIFIGYGGGVYKLGSGAVDGLASVNGWTFGGGLAGRPNGDLAVADATRSGVALFNSAGEVLQKYVGMQTPIGLAFDPVGSLWVASHDNGSVLRISAANQAAQSMASLSSPMYMAFDGRNNIWITQQYSGIKKIDENGDVLLSYDGLVNNYGIGLDGDRLILPRHQESQLNYLSGNQWATLAAGLPASPVDLKIDGADGIWLASGGNGSLLTLDQGRLITRATGLAGLSVMEVTPNGVYLAGNTGWAKLRSPAGELADLKLDAFTNNQPIAGLAAGSSLYALVAGYPVPAILNVTVNTPAVPPPAGTVVYQNTVPMAAMPSVEGYAKLDLGQWLPPYGGDFKVQVSRSGVVGTMTNFIHVGPHATSELRALQAEVPPGDSSLAICMRLDGADFTSISRVEVANVKPVINTDFPKGLAADKAGNIYYTNANGSSLFKAVPGQMTGTEVASGLNAAFGLAVDSDETMYVSSRSATTGRYELVAIKPGVAPRTVVDLGVTQTNGLVVNSKDEVLVGSPGQLLKVTKQGQLSTIPTAGLPAPRGIAIDGKDNVYAQNDSGGQLISLIKPDGTASIIFNGADGVENPSFEGDGYPNIAADCAENFYIAPYTWEKISQQGEEHVLAQVIARTGKVAVLFDTLKINPILNDIDYLSYDRFGNRLLMWNHYEAKVWSVPVTCGAISVDVHLLAKPGQKFSGASKAPVATVPLADGRTEYVWSLKDVTTTGAQVCFDASQSQVSLGELRKSIDSGFMRFQNSFTVGDVKVPLAIPQVRGTNLVNIAVATDKAEYPAQAVADVTTKLSNANLRAIAGDLHVEVFDAAGQRVGLVIQQAVNIVAQWALPVTAPFGIGTIVPALYTVKATLSQGALVLAQAQTDFTVLPERQDASAISQLGLDRKTYNASDRVRISSRAISQSANVILTNLTLMVQVRDVQGTLLYTHGHPVPQLLPGALLGYEATQALTNVPAGPYTVQQTLVDAQNRVIHTTQTSYTVGSGAESGFGLTGTITATPKTVRIGEPLGLAATATNRGNAALPDLPLSLWIVDPGTEAKLYTRSITQTLGIAATVPISSSWQAAGTAGKTYVAALVATLNAGTAAEKQMVLAQDSFSLTTGTPLCGTPQALMFTPDHNARPHELRYSNTATVTGLGEGCTAMASVNKGAFRVMRAGVMVLQTAQPPAAASAHTLVAQSGAAGYSATPRSVQDGDQITLELEAPDAQQTDTMTLLQGAVPSHWSVSAQALNVQEIPVWNHPAPLVATSVALLLLALAAYRRHPPARTSAHGHRIHGARRARRNRHNNNEGANA